MENQAIGNIVYQLSRDSKTKLYPVLFSTNSIKKVDYTRASYNGRCCERARSARALAPWSVPTKSMELVEYEESSACFVCQAHLTSHRPTWENHAVGRSMRETGDGISTAALDGIRLTDWSA